jgi:hypothetical protein
LQFSDGQNRAGVELGMAAPLLVKPTAGQRFQSINIVFNSSYSPVPAMIVVPNHEAGLIIENHRARVGTTLKIEHAEN